MVVFSIPFLSRAEYTSTSTISEGHSSSIRLKKAFSKVFLEVKKRSSVSYCFHLNSSCLDAILSETPFTLIRSRSIKEKLLEGPIYINLHFDCRNIFLNHDSTLRQKNVVTTYIFRLNHLKNIFSKKYKKMIRELLKVSKPISELIKFLRQSLSYPMSHVATFSFSGGFCY